MKASSAASPVEQRSGLPEVFALTLRQMRSDAFDQRLALVDQAGHFVVDEQPAALAAAIIGFFAVQEPGAAGGHP